MHLGTITVFVCLALLVESIERAGGGSSTMSQPAAKILGYTHSNQNYVNFIVYSG